MESINNIDNVNNINNMSLFIPFVFPSFTKTYIARAFADVGHVERVDLVAKQDRDGKSFNAVYVHFKKWYNTLNTRRLQTNILSHGEGKFYHDKSKYFWTVLQNKTTKHTSGDRKPRIDLGDAKSITAYIKPAKRILVPDRVVRKNADVFVKTEEPSALVDDVLEQCFAECLNLLSAPIEEWDTSVPADWDVEATEAEIEMAEMEADLDAEDSHIIGIDCRYVMAIEHENAWLHNEVAQLRHALIQMNTMYQAEQAKVRAFTVVEV